MTETLRDKFALAALPVMLAQLPPDQWKDAVGDAYTVADECMKARDYGKKKLNGTAPRIMVLQGEPDE